MPTTMGLYLSMRLSLKWRSIERGADPHPSLTIWTVRRSCMCSTCSFGYLTYTHPWMFLGDNLMYNSNSLYRRTKVYQGCTERLSLP